MQPLGFSCESTCVRCYQTHLYAAVRHTRTPLSDTPVCRCQTHPYAAIRNTCHFIVNLWHCVVLGAMCRVFTSAAVDKVCRDGQTAGYFDVLDRERLLVSIQRLTCHLVNIWCLKLASVSADLITGAALLKNNEASAKLTTANGRMFTSSSARLSSQSRYRSLDRWLTCFNVIGYWVWLNST